MPPPTLRRFLAGFRWQGVEVEPYKLSSHRGGEFCGASRQVIAGKKGEPVHFQLRYFELERGGYTSLERHRHCHVIIGARGRGRVKVGGADYQLRPLDIVYIGPGEPHQLSAGPNGKLGFFCIVDARRDRPRPVPAEDVRKHPPAPMRHRHQDNGRPLR
jgi:quercetin dioxygenase-like cupin family protein